MMARFNPAFTGEVIVESTPGLAEETLGTIRKHLNF
jgi:hypothetical protein